MKSNNDCTICLSNEINSGELFTNNCNHTFCRECLEQWLEYSNVCPLCRESNPTNPLELNKYNSKFKIGFKKETLIDILFKKINLKM